MKKNTGQSEFCFNNIFLLSKTTVRSVTLPSIFLPRSLPAYPSIVCFLLTGLKDENEAFNFILSTFTKRIQTWTLPLGSGSLTF